MNIFGFKFRKFESSTTTVRAIETWCVRWESLHRNIIDRGETNLEVQGFTSEVDAKSYAKELIDARRLLGDSGFKPTVYKQRTITNA